MIARVREFFRGAPPMPSVRASAAPYESASMNRRVSTWNPPDVTGTTITASNAVIRRRARAAYRNDALARAAVDALVTDIVGYGLTPRSRATDAAARSAVQDLFSRWAEHADAAGVLDFAALVSQIVRSMIMDGEVFVRLRPRQAEDGLPVPIQLEVLPAESVPEDFTDTTHRIRQGIEFNAIGGRVAYHFRPEGHAETHRVPADAVLHFYRADVPGQIRGVSWLATALVRLRSLDQMQDAVLQRQALANLFVATVTSQVPAGDVNALTGEVAPTVEGAPTLTMQPGVLQSLDPGEELKFSDPPDPPQGYVEFVSFELRAACASLGVPVQVVTGEWGTANDRIARTVLAAHRRGVMAIQHSIVIPPLKRFWRLWINRAVMTKDFPREALTSDRILEAIWSPQGWTYIHPVQDAEATKALIRSGLMSRSAAAAEQGEDIEAIDLEIAADQERADALGLTLDTDPRRRQANGLHRSGS